MALIFTELGPDKHLRAKVPPLTARKDQVRLERALELLLRTGRGSRTKRA